MTPTRCDIAQALDRAADRASNPASAKQCWYLAGLIAAGPNPGGDYQDWLLNGAPLSRAEASRMIDYYCGQEAA